MGGGGGGGGYNRQVPKTFNLKTNVILKQAKLYGKSQIK